MEVGSKEKEGREEKRTDIGRMEKKGRRNKEER